ncbi:DUF6934 family protein [Dyadobacter arcticus]|uniref:Uncharacterized protein n=1 Tax=Dyadobacter arcticus TaxID=1078754 RepID=A0ABX0UIM6_9BACT|nr:hypothetical protein [Dyadobacter arcticus]NIJ51894.1 hypothetical protein [Dyadobacter arcticus]
MNENGYPFKLSREQLYYEFVSVSKEKQVQKIVLISRTDVAGIYNLALLDVLSDGSLCDISETNNNDLRIVIATVIKIMGDFLTKNSNSYVIFRGSDSRRQRLYSIVIGRELVEFSKVYEVYGVKDGVRYPFSVNNSYEFYLIKKKL